MLKLDNIVKTYSTGEFVQNALAGVSICFRESEFVSILGPSGSGKTTLLNIIGGLDRYTSGDLTVSGVSTKKYGDADWDSYRNNSVGFVFQNYNLILHQSILRNVELALTLAGVSKAERREKSAEVLKKVGLGDHLHKKPNQLSGGQMQRVAIARALINNPDILLADEPTGALDSETSIQIMELLKEISKDKLVIMVTHNPELAEKYSSRTVRLSDGKIIGDTNPFDGVEEQTKTIKRKKVSMSFFTALSLSFNNLLTKKGRTVLTALAGSIGIIGIALILALSTGMNDYINDVQKETMTSYPITVSSETIDVSNLMGIRGEIIGEIRDGEADNSDGNTVRADFSTIENSEKITSSIVENNLTEFKKYLDNPDSEIHAYLGENGIVYSYDVNFTAYTYDPEGNFVNCERDTDDTSSVIGNAGQTGILGKVKNLQSGSADGESDFSMLATGGNGETVGKTVTDSYDVVAGNWPENRDEAVLVLNSKGEISATSLYRLGFISESDYKEQVEKIESGNSPDEISLDCDSLINRSFYIVPACYHYTENANGTFSPIEDIRQSEEFLLENSLELKIVGVIKPKDGAESADITTAAAYTSKLCDWVISTTDESPVITAQEADREINILNGMSFTAASDDEKVSGAKDYLSSLGISEKAAFYKMITYYSSGNMQSYDTGFGVPNDESTMAAALDAWLGTSSDNTILLKVYNEYIAGSTYEDNMEKFGKVSYDAPSSISIYADSFEDKDNITECIKKYNESAGEEKSITYTDYVALLTSSVTTIINGISYVLVAFVSISLIVSCIMIGIITHISVMERTKEIGILRALGASKGNISLVFNAETFIIGCFSGFLGIGVSLAALIPINSLIEKISGLTGLTAQLSVRSSAVLVAISVAITILGGLIPAKKAARKDPVTALRTE